MFDLASIAAVISDNATKIVVTGVVLLIYVVLDRLGAPRIEESADQSRLQGNAAAKAIAFTRLVYGFIGVLLMLLMWGVDLQSMLIFGSTFITVLGVAMFASWSLLSNITAHLILLVNPAFRRGAFVRIVDADNYAEGYVSELFLFSTKLVTENREVILYPNNLLLGRVVHINPRRRLDGIGKLPARSVQDAHQHTTVSGDA